MKIHSFIMLFATAGLATNAFAQPPVVKYDRFTQVTDVTGQAVHQMQAPFRHTDVIMVSAKIRESKLVELEFEFGTISTQWQYLNCHDVHFLVDEKPYADLGPGKYINAMQQGATEEMIIFPITREQLAFLANAKRIEYKICNDEKVLDISDMVVLRDFGPGLDQALQGSAPASGEKRGG